MTVKTLEAARLPTTRSRGTQSQASPVPGSLIPNANHLQISGTNLKISQATESDIPELCELLSVLFSQEAEFVPNYAAQSRGLSSIISNPDIGLILLARKDGRAYGIVNLLFTISTALGERVALLEDFVVIPSARGTGIGSQLLEKAIQVARLNGCKRITLLTDRTNESAQRLYQKHGFSTSAMIPLRLSLGEQ